MREIKFRGKIISELVVLNGKWCIGLLSKKGFEMFITTEGVNATTFKIDPETVGEFTGLHDKNGEEIYEGDIVKDILTVDGVLYIIEWSKDWAQFTAEEIKNMNLTMDLIYSDHFEVIGNVFENPELLKEVK